MTASHKHFAELQTLTVPFQVSDRGPCTVTINCQPCDDPAKHGEGLLGLYKDLNSVHGFPYIHATISSPVSRGYASIYGWIQITNAPGEPWVKDVYPLFQDLNYPYAMWGAEPTFIDLPGREGKKEEDWTARLFLVYSPDAAMTKTCMPVMAFEWGFWIKDFKPKVKELKQIEVTKWNEHLRFFGGEFPGWAFKETK